MLRNADGVGGAKFSGKKHYEGLRFNVISITMGWVGVQFPEKQRYITLEWPSTWIITRHPDIFQPKLKGHLSTFRLREPSTTPPNDWHGSNILEHTKASTTWCLYADPPHSWKDQRWSNKQYGSSGDNWNQRKHLPSFSVVLQSSSSRTCSTCLISCEQDTISQHHANVICKIPCSEIRSSIRRYL